MVKAKTNSARFRSATEFPKTIRGMEQGAAEPLYQEMRDCLIFTNRSRAQLIRYNNQYRSDLDQLKADQSRLQTLINQLSQEKAAITTRNQEIIDNLKAEAKIMAQHLDELAVAFDQVSDIKAENLQWDFLALPQRFFALWRAVKAIVLAWRRDHNSQDHPAL